MMHKSFFMWVWRTVAIALNSKSIQARRVPLSDQVVCMCDSFSFQSVGHLILASVWQIHFFRLSDKFGFPTVWQKESRFVQITSLQHLALRTSLGSSFKPRWLNTKKMQYQQFSISRKKRKCCEEVNLPKNKTAARGRPEESVCSVFTKCRKLEVRCCITQNKEGFVLQPYNQPWNSMAWITTQTCVKCGWGDVLKWLFCYHDSSVVD